MLDKKIFKPVITQKQCDEYAATAAWCNENNAHIEDRGKFYLVVENEPAPEPGPVEPTQLDRVEAQVMYTALMTDTLIEEVSADV